MIDHDSRLVQQAKTGNKAAFGKLVKKYQQYILILAYDFLGDYDDAKDVAQEAFIRAFQRLDQFQEKSKFSTWLHRITLNLSIDFHRKKQRHPGQSLDEPKNANEHLQSPETHTQKDEVPLALEREEISKLLTQALEHLSSQQRAAIILRYFQEKSTAEMAEIMNCAENTVRIHLFRGLAHLRKILNQKEFV